MPGLNQRGPENMGPMTGRKMGRCISDNAYPGPDYGVAGRRGYGQGAGFSRGRGCGRGFGPRGAWTGQSAAGPAASLAEEDLHLRAKALEQELEAVRNELKNLSKP